MNSTQWETSIREAKLQDAQALKRCLDRAYAPIKARLPDLPDVSGGLEDDIETNSVLIAEINGAVCGCAILRLDDTSAHLMNIAVDPDHKRIGLGRKLMDASEDLARRSGAKEICLTTHAGIPDNVALYHHLGWHITSRSGNKILMKKPI